ncbi:bifunctional phosphoserine phosphatase/homoserine phosphotransferase ThrH [Photobacterium galatheae]|uniref:phosphoserine phosphatase n=1 Tax=Photobacterium galatheae TaxID=1654360 RepID=A0A066RTS5_9GAMM|nr:bifunctional phosphoserine phosphatase/homoserine phosphotransferase ThrH [Photobacterium galatheae]KDM92521.1 hypothetical protein EA58_06150 [Photobacterium galatheae]MCM0147997.1 bifunctional phosphoserine phosphatase/homoserine phosphotransferase ThrH [Photobacterium galatheae]
MNIACIDMEGVLIPELWPLLAEKYDIPDLTKTTREEPDYEKLVSERINILNQEKITLLDVIKTVDDIEPLDGAKAFIDKLSKKYKVVLVSDAFYQMLYPLWLKIGQPKLYCHYFQLNKNGFIEKADYTRKKGKIEIIEKYNRNNNNIISVGDAFNDLEMLSASNTGYLFQPSDTVRKMAPPVNIVDSYDQILTMEQLN